MQRGGMTTPRSVSVTDGAASVQATILEPDPNEPSAFSKALAAVESHRRRVEAALGGALLARILFELRFVVIPGNTTDFVGELPYVGLALLSYMLVLFWLSARTRDRFGFGMALGIAVIEASYLVVSAAIIRPMTVGSLVPPLVVAAAHVPMAVFAFRASTAYPPGDTKRPWVIGFVTALVFVAIPWVAPALAGAAGR